MRFLYFILGSLLTLILSATYHESELEIYYNIRKQVIKDSYFNGCFDSTSNFYLCQELANGN